MITACFFELAGSTLESGSLKLNLKDLICLDKHRYHVVVTEVSQSLPPGPERVRPSLYIVAAACEAFSPSAVRWVGARSPVGDAVAGPVLSAWAGGSHSRESCRFGAILTFVHAYSLRLPCSYASFCMVLLPVRSRVRNVSKSLYGR